MNCFTVFFFFDQIIKTWYVFQKHKKNPNDSKLLTVVYTYTYMAMLFFSSLILLELFQVTLLIPMRLCCMKMLLESTDPQCPPSSYKYCIGMKLHGGTGSPWPNAQTRATLHKGRLGKWIKSKKRIHRADLISVRKVYVRPSTGP